jgi:asparagine synthase (glutamine-hydrolysing)
LLIHNFAGRYKELMREAQKGIVPENLRNHRNDVFAFNSFQTVYIDASKDRFSNFLNEVEDTWTDAKGAQLALQQLSFGMASGSTRSVMAFLGYLERRRAFLDRCRVSKNVFDDGFFQAHAQ